MKTQVSYPQVPQEILKLFFLSMKHFFPSYRRIWPLAIVIMLLFWLNQHIEIIHNIIIEQVCSVVILFTGYITVNLALSGVHQNYSHQSMTVIRDKSVWISLCVMFIYLLVPFIAMDLLLVHLDFTQGKIVFLLLVLSSFLIFAYLLSIFTCPLLLIDQCSLWQAVIVSIQYTKKNWICPVIIYILLMSMVLTVLPSSQHMLWLAQYHLNSPVSFISISFFFTVVINLWLLVVNDYKVRLA